MMIEEYKRLLITICIQNIVKEHKAINFDPNDLKDYTDFFIDEQRRQGEGSTFTSIN